MSLQTATFVPPITGILHPKLYTPTLPIYLRLKSGMNPGLTAPDDICLSELIAKPHDLSVIDCAIYQVIPC